MLDFSPLHSGKLYNAMDEEIMAEQRRCIARVNAYNATTPEEGEKRQELVNYPRLKRRGLEAAEL